jgi:adenylate cyclase
MSDASVNRKLAAILSADVVGYSRLMADDEVATVETLKRYRAEIGRIIEHHKGRIVNAPGDNILAEFASAVEAVRAAVEIQRSIQEKNADLAEERRMRFRVGVNLGDIIEEADGTIYGDGVNIAARLEALCEPGGICVSGTIFDQVEGKVQASFEFAGEQKVKNIEKPIRTYHLQRTPSRTWFWLRAKRKSRLVAAGLAAALLVSVVIWQAKNLDEPVDNADETLLEMPTGPVIAVLPFDNMSDDPAQDYFSDGLTEDIITELATFRELHRSGRKRSQGE